MKTNMVYLGIRGSVVAVDGATGRELWARALKGTDFVNVVLDGDNLYAATHGEISCLDPQTGAVRWHNPLKGRGWGLVSVAVQGAAGNGGPVLAAEKRRRDEQAAASAAAAS
jgi:outer membrane protein assembly factor BamB